MVRILGPGVMREARRAFVREQMKSRGSGVNCEDARGRGKDR